MKIQKPTIGRIVEFTAFRGHDNQARDAYAGVVTRVHDEPGVVDLVTFGAASLYFVHAIRFDAEGAASTWRYPPRSDETVEV